MQDEEGEFCSPFRKLQQTLGTLMYCWCQLEKALTETLAAATEGETGQVADSFNQRFARLKAHFELQSVGNEMLFCEVRELVSSIDRVRRRRNLISHRLTGIDGYAARGEPHITCSKVIRGRLEAIKITQSELSQLLEDIMRCVSDLSRVAYFVKCPSALVYSGHRN